MGNDVMKGTETSEQCSIQDLGKQIKTRLEEGRVCRKVASDILSKPENLEAMREGFKKTFDKIKNDPSILKNPNVQKLLQILNPENSQEVTEKLNNPEELKKYLEITKQVIDKMEPEILANFIETFSQILCNSNHNNKAPLEEQLKDFSVDPDAFLNLSNNK